jgi:hypothetical protein
MLCSKLLHSAIAKKKYIDIAIRVDELGISSLNQYISQYLFTLWRHDIYISIYYRELMKYIQDSFIIIARLLGGISHPQIITTLQKLRLLIYGFLHTSSATLGNDGLFL